MPTALSIQQGATRGLRVTIADDLAMDFTGTTVTLTLHRRKHDGGIGDEVWRAEIAGGVTLEGVLASTTLSATDTAALPVGRYWLCLAVAFPAAGDDVVVRWDEYPVLVEATGPVGVGRVATDGPVGGVV